MAVGGANFADSSSICRSVGSALAVSRSEGKVMGGQASKLREDLEATQRDLSFERTRAKGLQSDADVLRQEVAAQESQLLQRERELADAARECVRRLDLKEEELIKAVKQTEILEELRVSDALLVKSITTAMLHTQPGVSPPPPPAAALIAGEGEGELRSALNQTLARLSGEEAMRKSLAQASRSDQRQELCRALWLQKMCDASLTLRSSNLMVLGGLRMPRPLRDGQAASGLSGVVGVLRRFGAEDGSGDPWAAVGGSLLWDARERELSALRFAMCGQPLPNQRVCLGFDHTGSLTGSLRSNWDAFTLHATGSINLNARGGKGVGLELSYDLD